MKLSRIVLCLLLVAVLGGYASVAAKKLIILNFNKGEQAEPGANASVSL
jgi:hypothetical protein